MIRPTESMVHPKTVEEHFVPGACGLWIHPTWESRFPELVQGVTGPPLAAPDEARDFALFSDPPSFGASASWEVLALETGFSRVAHARQVHGNRIHLHRTEDWASGEGLRIVGDGDGHITNHRGVLLGVAGADCVPIFLTDPTGPAVGVVHAGWRGTVAGVLPAAVGAMADAYESPPAELVVHLGPSICGSCYEVGREVFDALGLPYPGKAAPIDLRACLAAQAIGAGVPVGNITCSSWCTRCGASPFFSHREGDSRRHVGFIGIRPE